MNLFWLCIAILLVKIFNVALGTLRTIISVKGKHLIASLVGFIEVFIWFVIVKEALNTPEKSLWIAISYSLGSAIGTYIGGMLSKRFIKTNLNVQVITENKEMTDIIRNEGYGVTVINVEGRNAEKEKFMLFIEINNKNLNHLKQLVKNNDKNAFIVINETKYVVNGYIN